MHELAYLVSTVVVIHSSLKMLPSEASGFVTDLHRGIKMFEAIYSVIQKPMK